MAVQYHCSALLTAPASDEKTENEPIVKNWEYEDEYPMPEHTPRSFQHVFVFSLFASNILFAAASVFLYLNGQCPVAAPASNISPSPISTIPGDTRPSIRYEPRKFTHALRYNETSGELYRTIDPSEPPLFGDPRTTIGIDRAWKELLKRGSFTLSTAEALLYAEKGIIKEDFSGHYYAELEVFHNLDCLNAVRLQLDKDYYYERGPQHGHWWPKHVDRTYIDYCLDRLRQTVQCSADLSIILMLAQDSQIGQGDIFTQQRTCSKWEDVRSWLDGRQERIKVVKQQTYGTV